MTVPELIAEVRRQMLERADPEFAAGVRSFFREPVEPLGVRSSDVHKIAQFAYKELKQYEPAQRNPFCTELWKGGKLEEGALVPHVYRRFANQCGSCEFNLFERWMDRYVHNWAHCDGIASWLLAASIANEPSLKQKLFEWPASRNRWKRRAAAVAFLQEAKKGRSTDEIFHIANLLRDDPDEMVQKGLGWLLKETYPKKPADVMLWLRANPSTPRLVVRYSAEKMTDADRSEVIPARPR